MKKSKLFWALLFLLFLNFLSWNFLLSLQDKKAEVVFFDVGQGDAVFIKTPQGHHILIDGGPGDKILEHIGKELSFLEDKIDLLILTHPHYDHLSGLMEILQIYDVENIMCTGVEGESDIAKEWREIAKERGYIEAIAGKRVFAKNFSLEIVYPEESLEGETVSDLNTASVISYLAMDGRSFLFTGDAYASQEKEVLSSYNIPEVDVLKVGHHGSKTSTSSEFISALSPSYGVIMAGEGNRHGHPHEATIQTLEKHNVEVLRTDEHGNIRFVY